MTYGLYTKSIEDTLEEIATKCGQETVEKVYEARPRIINRMGETKTIDEFMKTALLKVKNVESANKASDDRQHLERCNGASSPDYYKIRASKNAEIFWKQFIDLFCIHFEEKALEIGCNLVQATYQGKSVPSVGQVFRSILQYDIVLAYYFIIETVYKVHNDCYNKENFGEEGFYERDTTDFTHKLRADLVHDLKGYNIEAYQKLIVDFPVLASLPEFHYQPGQWHFSCG
jgi:hypothetical protein